jgi:4-amino-4-deoxy-L-arabinose transferase-like glycosyltransferase
MHSSESNPSREWVVKRLVRQMPRWYSIALGVLFACYLAGWLISTQALVPNSSAEESLSAFTGGDSSEYFALSDSLLAAGHFALPGEAYEYFRTPGYPAFAATIVYVTGSYAAVTFIQILLTFITALLLLRVVTRMCPRPTGEIASLLFLANPLVLTLSLQVMTDALFTFLLFAGIAALVVYLPRRPLLATVLAALLFDAAVYVRPMGILALPICIAPILISRLSVQRKLTYAALLVGIVALLMLPWMVRNRVHSGVLAFSSITSYQLAAYNLPIFDAFRHRTSQNIEIQKIVADTGIPVTEWRGLSSSEPLGKYAMQQILTSPLHYAMFHVLESTGFFVNSGLVPLLAFFSSPLHYTLPSTTGAVNIKAMLMQGHPLLFFRAVTSPWWAFAERLLIFSGLVLAAIGFYSLRRNSFAWLAVFVILYLALLTGPIAMARYRLPAEPFLALFIATGLLVVATRFKHYAKIA